MQFFWLHTVFTKLRWGKGQPSQHLSQGGICYHTGQLPPVIAPKDIMKPFSCWIILQGVVSIQNISLLRFQRRRISAVQNRISISRPQARLSALLQALIARGVIGDFRAPDILRFGFTPLYIGFEDIYDAVQHLRAVMENKEWDSDKFRNRSKVTWARWRMF